MQTRVIRVPSTPQLGRFQTGDGLARLDRWSVDAGEPAETLEQAAAYLRSQDVPVAFPTETVYGLGADATRSASVKGIFSAKARPADNPLIVHVCDLQMLRDLLGGRAQDDCIPPIYRPLIDRFWPGPLTILLPNPPVPRLAPEVTAGLSSFGVRMPSSPLALSLIRLAGVPLAAPSANASTRPSPTTAQHVKDDLDGRIELILDGGPCQVGVESTVVDGLCHPPVVLRPGGIGLDDLRACPGWESVTKGYKDSTEVGKEAPRAPGMKYKHYSPRARVVLYESTCEPGRHGVVSADIAAMAREASRAGEIPQGDDHGKRAVGIIRTRRWTAGAGFPCRDLGLLSAGTDGARERETGTSYQVYRGDLDWEDGRSTGELLDIDLGRDTRGIAHGLFAALRELDQRGADVIFVDGIGDETDIAAAVMNRLRKAASDVRT